MTTYRKIIERKYFFTFLKVIYYLLIEISYVMNYVAKIIGKKDINSSKKFKLKKYQLLIFKLCSNIALSGNYS